MIDRKMLAPLLAALLLMAVGGTACERHEGPAERAGEKIDNAMDKGSDKMKDAGEKMGDAMEDAGDKMKDAAD